MHLFGYDTVHNRLFIVVLDGLILEYIAMQYNHVIYFYAEIVSVDV